MSEKHIPVQLGDGRGDLKELLIAEKVHVGNGYYSNRFFIRTQDDQCITGSIRTDFLLETLLPLLDRSMLEAALKKLNGI